MGRALISAEASAIIARISTVGNGAEEIQKCLPIDTYLKVVRLDAVHR